jgi:hypothetical protein
LAVSLALLLGLSIAAFYLNRNIVFEQKTAVNYMQSAKALEYAEAGLEWATGMLNSPYDIDGSCVALTTSAKSFRKIYVLTKYGDASSPSSDVIPATNTYPGCALNGAAWACKCPTPTTSEQVANLGSSLVPKFTVAFEAVAGDAEAVRVTSWGCTAQAAVCRSGQTTGADASARLSVILKLKPVLRAAPSSSLTCGTSCTIGGSYNIVNSDVGTNGILVNAGTTITTSPGTTLSSIPGQPTANALVGSDSSLSSLASSDPTCNQSQMFNAYFGSSIANYMSNPTTKTLSCGSAADCNAKLMDAYDQGWRDFYFSSDVQLSGNGTLGSLSDPITMVTPGALTINGNWNVYGMVFSNSADYNNLGTGAANITGAIVSCAAYNNNGNGTLAYSAAVMTNLRRSTALAVRVPGSWRDFTLKTIDTKP